MLNHKPLLDLIARHELKGIVRQGVKDGYDLVAQKAFDVYPPPKLITSMTVAEVLRWQTNAVRCCQIRFSSKTKGRSKIKYSAAGRYQITVDRLRDIASDFKGSLFDAKMQELLVTVLLYQRGWNAWTAGTTSNEYFADSLSQEWPSLPFNTGESYYKDELLVSRNEMLQVLSDIRGE